MYGYFSMLLNQMIILNTSNAENYLKLLRGYLIGEDFFILKKKNVCVICVFKLFKTKHWMIIFTF